MEEEPGDLSTLLGDDLLQQALQEVSGLESFGSSRTDFSQTFTTPARDNLSLKSGQPSLVSLSCVPVTSLQPVSSVSHTTSAIVAAAAPSVPVNRPAASHINSGLSQPLILIPSTYLPNGSISFIQPQVVVTSSPTIATANKNGMKRTIQTLLPKPMQPVQPSPFYPTFKIKNTSLSPIQHVLGASISSNANLLPAGTILHHQDPYLPMTKMTILPPGPVGDDRTCVTTSCQILSQTAGSLGQPAPSTPSPTKNSYSGRSMIEQTSSVSVEKKPRPKRRKKLLGKRKQPANTKPKPIVNQMAATKELGNNMPLITNHIPNTCASRLEDSNITTFSSVGKINLNGKMKIKEEKEDEDLKEKYKANHISNFIPNYKEIPPKNDFSFSTFLKEVMNSRPRGPGRPKKPFSDEEKKQIKNIKAEMGVGESRIRALDLLEVGERSKKKKKEDLSDDENMENDKEIKTMKCGITRSGRVSKLPKKTLDNFRSNGIRIESPSPPITEPLATTGAITNMSFAPPPAVDVSSMGGIKNHAKFLRWTCKVCGKFYLGAKHVALHLKNFPDHGFNTQTETKDEAKVFNPETWVKETDASTILNLVAPKLFDSFTLWELLGKKVAIKQLGTPEILASIFADIQALVMDLKNMVDQCLNNVRINSDSFSVIVSPMISTILGQNGGGERFVLPYNQIPVHYHTLLGFPKGLKNSQPPDLLSPDSTNDIFPPEEENSQMSMASDTPERPIAEKVVLEANLGTREDIDEETQDSSRMTKRPRLDSESHSAASPPPQTPEFLNHEDESNLSSSSNLGKDLNLPENPNIDDISVRGFSETDSKVDELSCNTPIKDIITRTASQINNQSGRSIFTESAKTKLPSFSSIICGSPKASITEASEQGNSPLLLDSHHLSSDKIGTSKDMCPQGGGVSESAPVSPGSEFVPGLVNISCASVSHSFQQRRSSVDQVLMCATNKLVGQNSSAHPFSPGKNSQTMNQLRDVHSPPMSSSMHMDRSSSMCSDPISVHSSSMSPDTQLRRYSFESDSLSDIIKERSMSNIRSPLRTPTPGTNSFQTTSYSVFSTVSSPSHMGMNTSNNLPMNTTNNMSMNNSNNLSMNTSNNLPMFLDTPPRGSGVPDISAKDFQLFTCTPFTKPTVPLPLTCLPENIGSSKKMESLIHPSRHSEFECSTHVTFSDQMHPIPSVSPLKDNDFDCGGVGNGNKSSSMPARVTASPNLLNDIESVLRETDEFPFHSALTSQVENVPGPAKTPEKLLTSIPPAEIMKKKPQMLFEDFSQN